MNRPKHFDDLFPVESLFLADWEDKRFVRYEGVRYEGGRLVLNPWPKTIKSVKFGSRDQGVRRQQGDFELKQEVAEFFEFVRTAGEGEIHRLEIRHGLPFSMEIEHRRDMKGAGNE
jgi:hypothetical protein